MSDPGFQIREGPGQVHSLNSKNIYTKFSKYFYKNNAEIKTQYNCSVILKFQSCTVQISHKSYAGSSLRGFISSIRLGFFLEQRFIIQAHKFRGARVPWAPPGSAPDCNEVVTTL